MSHDQPLTELLHAAAEGDSEAASRLYEALYDDLRRLARRQLSGRRNETLDTIGLVNEAYLKLAGGSTFKDRGHFLCTAARAMRQIVVDHARAKRREKRGGGAIRTTLDDHHATLERQIDQVLSVDQALARLTAEKPRLTQVVECRYFAGLTEPETAQALEVSERTVRRLWAEARDHLRQQLAP
jgi:RNA polymerase sigma factor (TIGR02999 family)